MTSHAQTVAERRELARYAPRDAPRVIVTLPRGADPNSVPAALLDVIDERVILQVHDIDGWGGVTHYAVWPSGELTAARERTAVSLNAGMSGSPAAMPVILPAAADWLRNTIDSRLGQHQSTVIAVPDLARRTVNRRTGGRS